MNAFEKRRAGRQAKSRIRYIEGKDLKALNLNNAEKYYIRSFYALNGQNPLVIPSRDPDALVRMADVLWARLHELEMGGNDE